jgi:hypothetical protein
VVGRSLRLERCMEGRWDTPTVVSRIKLVALIRECFLIKEHLMRTFAVEQQSCESMNSGLMRGGSGDDSMAASFVDPWRLNLYLDYVS